MIHIWMAAALVALLSVQGSAGEKPEITSEKERVSYGIGVDMARNIRQIETEVDLDILIRGLKDGLSGGKLLMTDQELLATRNAIRQELMRKEAAQKRNRTAAGKLAAESNRIKGAAFLAENKTREGVVSLPSGLQYKILKAGDGRKPTDADTVEVHYRGTLVDGTVFGDSRRSGKPATFKVKGGVIPGWAEALKLMPVGSRWQIFLPPGLAYGDRGKGQAIGPNATLIFDVELLAVK